MSDFWRGKKVFLTGHTGFKGGWLSLWLHQLGARVLGFSLAPPTEPNLFVLARIQDLVEHQIGDIRDLAAVRVALDAFRPDIVLHLAAQPLLRRSYDTPVETFATNVMGSVHIMEAARRCASARVTLIVTTDKCYENTGQHEGYRETDRMGGHDPYSSSKGCAELATSAYGRSYFNTGRQSLASGRAGNVIGGGDWAQDRLMTEIIAALMEDRLPLIRRPQAIRPWQHVLEPLAGYLRAVEYLWETMPPVPQAWNFGPAASNEVTVADVAREVCRLWGSNQKLMLVDDRRSLHEAAVLKLDSTKACRQLGWQPVLTLPDALGLTVEWYRRCQGKEDMQALTLRQISEYQKRRASLASVSQDNR